MYACTEFCVCPEQSGLMFVTMRVPEQKEMMYNYIFESDQFVDTDKLCMHVDGCEQ